MPVLDEQSSMALRRTQLGKPAGQELAMLWETAHISEQRASA